MPWPWNRILAVLLLAALPACAARVLPAVPDDVVYYTDERAAELFADESLYAMTGLVRHEVYLREAELNADFHFDGGVNDGDKQVDNARSFALTAFALREVSALEESPYGELIANQEIRWESVCCRIYIGARLAFHDRYDSSGRLMTDGEGETRSTFRVET